MPKYGSGGMSGGNITFGVDFKIDNSNLDKLKKSLSEIQSLSSKNVEFKLGTDAASELKKIKTTANEVEKALMKAFNADLGTINISKFNQELSRIGINKIAQDFSKLGATGQNAFNNITASALSTNTKLIQTSATLDKIRTTLANSARWTISSSIVNTFISQVSNAFTYVKALDTSLNDIRIITGKSAQDMASFAEYANRSAKAIGQTTTAYTDAALIYYQQGLNENQAKTLAETTLKVANITGQAADQVSEEITAVMNGYQLGVDQVEGAFDSLAAVAATTASDLEEISTGMSKVAATANMMGVPLDSLNAQLATIVSVTRQAPESVGTALKTIYARMGDLKMGGTDEDGVVLGDVSGQMEAAGIQILDETGNLRDMGDVINDVAAKWNTWTKAQRIAMAEAMAGKRQYNNLIALFDNWDMYTQALNTSMTAQGTIEEQNSIKLESLSAKYKQLQAAMDDVKDSAISEDDLKAIVDLGTDAATVLARFIDGMGGAQGTLAGLGALGANVFGKQITEGIVTAISNLRVYTNQLDKAKAEAEFLQMLSKVNTTGLPGNASELEKSNLVNLKENINVLYTMKNSAMAYRDVMSTAQAEELNNLI